MRVCDISIPLFGPDSALQHAGLLGRSRHYSGGSGSVAPACLAGWGIRLVQPHAWRCRQFCSDWLWLQGKGFFSAGAPRPRPPAPAPAPKTPSASASPDSAPSSSAAASGGSDVSPSLSPGSAHGGYLPVHPRRPFSHLGNEYFPTDPTKMALVTSLEGEFGEYSDVAANGSCGVTATVAAALGKALGKRGGAIRFRCAHASHLPQMRPSLVTCMRDFNSCI